jgi:methyl-accepting chemotaxis protein
VLQYPPNAFTGFYIATKAVGSITVREADIKNLEEVTEGKSTVLILDPHGLMGTNLAPLEAVNKIAQLQADLERLAKTAYEYEQSVLEYKSMVTELNARVAKYAQELLELQVSLDNIRNEIKQLNRESDNYDKMIQEINDKMASLVATIKDLASVMSEVPQPAPAVEAKSTAKEEKEGGEGGKPAKS